MDGHEPQGARCTDQMEENVVLLRKSLSFPLSSWLVSLPLKLEAVGGEGRGNLSTLN